jgi:hypothetical protein
VDLSQQGGCEYILSRRPAQSSAYSAVWENFHSLFNHIKESCVQDHNNDAAFAEGLHASLQDFFWRIQKFVQCEIESLDRDIKSYRIHGLSNTVSKQHLPFIASYKYFSISTYVPGMRKPDIK